MASKELDKGFSQSPEEQYPATQDMHRVAREGVKGEREKKRAVRACVRAFARRLVRIVARSVLRSTTAADVCPIGAVGSGGRRACGCCNLPPVLKEAVAWRTGAQQTNLSRDKHTRSR